MIEVSIEDFTKIVVGVDPSVTSGEDADETGIIVVASGPHQPDSCVLNHCTAHGYVLQDATLPKSNKNSVDKWVQRVVEVFDDWNANLIVIEGNQGQELLDMALRTVRAGLPVARPNARDSKKTRAEPVVALYEQGRVHHLGDPTQFAQLEEAMCFPAGTLVETARGQVPIEEVTNRDYVVTRRGCAPVVWSGQTGLTDTLVRVTHERGSVLSTPCHPIFSNQQFVSAKNVPIGSYLGVNPKWASTVRPSHGVDGGGIDYRQVTIATPKEKPYIKQYGSPMAERWSQNSLSTTSITILRIIALKILRKLLESNMHENTQPPKGLNCGLQNSAEPTQYKRGLGMKAKTLPVKSVMRSITPDKCDPLLAHQSAVESVEIELSECAVPVYNLQVEDGYLPEYFANGILVHNCTWVPPAEGKRASKSPDRMDALVWALSELNLQGRKTRKTIAGIEALGFGQRNGWAL